MSFFIRSESDLLIEIKLLRIRKGIKSKDMAAAMGVDRFNYWKLENGKSKMTIEKLLNILRILNQELRIDITDKSVVKETFDNGQA